MIVSKGNVPQQSCKSLNVHKETHRMSAAAGDFQGIGIIGIIGMMHNKMS